LAIVPSEPLRSSASGAGHPPVLRPRFLHVATRYLRGGSERRLRDIVHAVPEADHDLVLGSESDVDLAIDQVRPARVIVVPTLVRNPDPRRDLLALRHLTRLIAARHYDLAVTHQSKAGVLARVAAARAGLPVVHSLSMANFGPGYGRWQSTLFRSIETRLVRRTSAYVVVGTDLARRFRDLGAPDHKLHVVRSGVPLTMPPDRAAARAEVCGSLDLPADRPLLVYLGSLEARKNVLSLPTLLRKVLARSSARPFMVVAGEGPLAGALEGMLAAQGLTEDARLVGFVHEPGTLVRAADAVVLLSSAEGVPQVLVQAAAAQTPFVAYDVDGVRELCELGADGSAVPLGDVTAAAAAVARVLEARERSRETAPDLGAWSPDTIRAGYRAAIASALEGREGADPMELARLVDA
jgi:glycosyltransferase involved in cell wall biosynthesis